MLKLQHRYAFYRSFCYQSVFLISLLLYTALAQAQLTVHFSYCSATLSPAEKEKIQDFIHCSGSAGPRVSIAGHTGNTPGREKANQILSEKRADAVAAFLRTLPCSTVVDSAIGYGGIRPIAKASKAANRRSEIRLQESVATVGYDEDSAMGKARFAALYGQLATPPQSFCISPGRDTTLVGEKGTIIRISKGDLTLSECSCVTILLNEYYDRSDMILNNLTTTSNGKPLESGGMIKIEAMCNGRQVPMAAGRSIGIWVPTDTVLPGMQLFTAKRDTASQLLNWSGAGENMDAVEYRGMRNWCTFANDIKPGKCPFFFCGIRNFFAGLFTSLSARQRKLDAYNNLSTNEQRLMNKYRMDTAQLLAALKKSKENNTNIIKYYTFQNYNWGYRNCDRYLPGVEYKNLYVKEEPKNYIDVKFVAKGIRSIEPAFARNKDYQFSDLMADQKGWAIAIKLTGHSVFLSMKETNTSDKTTTPEYREITLAQLQETIRLADAN